MRGSKNSDSQSTVRDNSEDQDQIYSLKQEREEDLLSQGYNEKSSHKLIDTTRPDSKMSSSYIQDTRSTSSTPAEKFKSVYEGNMPTRVNSRDAPLARVDEIKELKGSQRETQNLRDLRDYQEARDMRDQRNQKDSKDGKKRDKSENSSWSKTDKTGKIEKKSHYMKNSLDRYESEDEYQMNKSLQWETLMNKSLKSTGFDQGMEKIITGKDGIEYTVVDKGVWTTDELKMIQVTNFSKAVQVNDGVALDNQESKSSFSRNIYFLPYNPNNAYGLRGETYFNTKNQVFGAQPRIPDLASSLLFQNSYFLDKSNR
jgi:hypothetical protein